VNGTPCIEVEDLALRYHGKPAFKGLGLSIPRGEITALIGPSGCGKTSFLTCLNRLTDMIAGCTVTGRARLDGLDLFAPDLDLRALRRKVGMIFQKPNPFPLSIGRNLDLPLRELGVRGRGEREARMRKVLEEVGLWEEVRERLDAPALSLSGGQQQRLCMARALVLEPEVLLLDEPCSALDPLASEVVEEHIRALRGRLTLVIVTHNLAQARRIADHVGVFWTTDGCGRLIEKGACKTIFENPRDPLTRAYVRGLRG